MAKALAVVKEKGLSKKGDYRKELAKYAKDDSARLPSGSGNIISIRGKKFSFQGGTLAAPLKVVAIDYGFENAMYKGMWDPENPQPPMCFAIGKTFGDLRPHQSSPEPQCETCADCEHNKFGSAETGRGKACKNSVRIAILSTAVKVFDVPYIEKTDGAVIKLPPTSVKGFRGYLKKITEGLQLPLFSVVTALDFDDDSDLAYPVVTTQFEDEVNDKRVLNALIAKREVVQGMLLEPFDVTNYDAKPKTTKKKGAKKKGKF